MTINDWVTELTWEGTSLNVRARLVDINGDPILQAVVASIFYRSVSELMTEVIPLTEIPIDEAVFDTYQPWSLDATGYNFAWILPAATFPIGGLTYNVPIEFKDKAVPANPFIVPVQAIAQENYLTTPLP